MIDDIDYNVLLAECEDLRRERDEMAKRLSEAQARVADAEGRIEQSQKQEPVAWIETGQLAGGIFKKKSSCIGPCKPLYAAPVSPAAQVAQGVADDVVRNDARYRAVRDNLGFVTFTDSDKVLIGVSVSKCWGQPYYGDRQMDFDDAADTLLAAAQQQKEGSREPQA